MKKKFSELDEETKEKKYQKKVKDNQYIFLMKLDEVAMGFVAAKLGMKSYDTKKKYFRMVDPDNNRDREPFRDVHIQQMIIYLLEKEFDLQNYVEIGLVKEHFPVHHFQNRQNISDL